MVVYWLRSGAGGAVRCEGPIKGVMGRLDTAQDPKPAPGAAARTPGGHRPRCPRGPGRAPAVTPAPQDRPWTRPRAPGAAMPAAGRG